MQIKKKKRNPEGAAAASAGAHTSCCHQMGPSIPEKGEKFGILQAVNHRAAPFRLGRLWKLLPLDAAPFIIENKLKDS